MAATKDKDKAHHATTIKNKKSFIAEASDFFEGSKSEIKKVTWPNKQEIKVTTFAVIGFVIFMSIYLSIVDMTLLHLVEWILAALMSLTH